MQCLLGVSVAVTAGVVAEVAPIPEVAETKAVVPTHEVRVVPIPLATGVVPDGVAIVEGPPGTTDQCNYSRSQDQSRDRRRGHRWRRVFQSS